MPSKISEESEHPVKDCNGELIKKGDYVLLTEESPMYFPNHPELNMFRIMKVYKKPFANGTNCSAEIFTKTDIHSTEKLRSVRNSFPLNSNFLRKLSDEEYNNLLKTMQLVINKH